VWWTEEVMTFASPPATAAWRHRDARDGFEVCFFERDGDGVVARGTTAAVEEAHGFAVEYEIHLDAGWRTREATVRTRTAARAAETRLELGPGGRWRVDGAERADLDGIADVDLESSSMTNAFPIRRLGLAVGESAPAPAAWVRALDLAVEPLEQHYERLADEGDRLRFAYDSPEHGFAAELAYDRYGLSVDYPGIAVRAA
jgi:hypothetical protein